MNLDYFSSYHVWAGDKIRDLLKNLTDEEFNRDLGSEFSYNTIRKLVFHSLDAVSYCLALVNETDPDIFNEELDKTRTLSKLKLLQKWHEVDKEYSEKLKTDRKGSVTIPPFLGKEFAVDKLDFLLQYITHSTYHRGQIIIALKKIGKEVIGTDYLFYLNEILNK